MHTHRIVPFCLVFILLIFFDKSFGQTEPNSLSPGKTREVNSMLPSTSKKSKHRTGIFSPRVKKANVKHTARYEFYERIEQAAKEKQRILKKLSKAQYSDPRYFGHKKIPKRRPPHKMRYCGECGIRH